MKAQDMWKGSDLRLGRGGPFCMVGYIGPTNWFYSDLEDL